MGQNSVSPTFSLSSQPLPKQNNSSKITLVGNDFINSGSKQVSAACFGQSSIHAGVILEQLSVDLPWLSGYTN
jgi:hypothetical protein